MRKLFIALALFFGFSVAQAQTYGYPAPFYYNYGWHYGYPYGWGYVYYPSWPTYYWGNVDWNGYSYYSYYNYQPRYVSYGVISYSPEKDVWGSAWGQRTRDHATFKANGFCSDATCKPVVWVQGGCAAISTSKATKIVTWGTGVDRENAAAGALTACRNTGTAEHPVTDCVERAWLCSF